MQVECIYYISIQIVNKRCLINYKEEVIGSMENKINIIQKNFKSSS
jgi:hypothetical protein